MNRLLTPVVLCALALAPACSSHPSRSECTAIVEHMVDLMTAGKLAEDGARVPKDYGTVVEKWRSVLKDEKDATHDALMQMCTSQMASSASSCVLAAKTEADLVTCFGS